MTPRVKLNPLSIHHLSVMNAPPAAHEPAPPVAASPGEFRRALRRESISRREALPEAQQRQFTQAIVGHLRQGFPQLARLRVAFCWPFRQEPDLRPLICDWLTQEANGFMALLPVVTGPATPLVFRRWWPDTPMQSGSYDIPFPAVGEFIVPEALLIPVNAFDAAGFRLGYGGGYFDRTLAILPPSTLSIGVGFELARVETLYPQPHDQRLGHVVTEAGIFSPENRDPHEIL